MAKTKNVGAPKRKEARTANIQTLVEPTLDEKFRLYLATLPAGSHRRPSDFIRAKIIGWLEEAKMIKRGEYL
jgi:hypothetical protein